MKKIRVRELKLTYRFSFYFIGILAAIYAIGCVVFVAYILSLLV